MTDPDDALRDKVAARPVPDVGGAAFTAPPALADATVALVTTAALHLPEQPGWDRKEATFRVIGHGRDDLRLGHWSTNFDRSGVAEDLDVVFPVHRLAELAADGTIGAVAPRHLSFLGSQDEEMTALRLGTGPAAARLLLADAVDVVLLTPV